MSWLACVPWGPKLSKHPHHPHQQEAPEGSQQSKRQSWPLPASGLSTHCSNLGPKVQAVTLPFIHWSAIG